MTLHFDRTVSPALLAELKPDGRFSSLVARRNAMPWVLDVQLRRSRDGECHASLYAGLTSVLDVRERDGLFALRARDTHRSAAGFFDGWTKFRSPEALAEDWAEVDAYVGRLLEGRIDPRWYRREGVVQALLCSGTSTAYGAVQREAVVWSDGPALVSELVIETSDAIWAAVLATGRFEPWWPGIRNRGVRKAMGGEVDVLAVNAEGQLLCIEAKPAEETAGIVWSAAQVLVYAEVFARWVEQDPTTARGDLSAMADQRSALGLLDSSWTKISDGPMRVTPVVAIGPGLRSSVALARLADIVEALEPVARHSLVDPFEVWFLDAAGEPADIWRPQFEPSPKGRGTKVPPIALLGAAEAVADFDLISEPEAAHAAVVEDADTFVAAARRAAVAWKDATPLLVAAAKLPSPYGSRPGALPFVLPGDYRWDNLLPEAREVARTRFAAAGIHWHGDADGPNPHLLSSQIQCLNALAPLVNRPEDLARWLGEFLPVDEVLPFGATTESPFDATDHVVFEWQGQIDHLGEWSGHTPTRGARATSIDAAVRYRTPSGELEVALIEWKYTESYPYAGRLDGSAYYHYRRLVRFRTLAQNPESPIRLDLGVDYEDLFADPTYQLFRQQLLAWRLEVTSELGVSRAVVVHAAPAANVALLQESLGMHRFQRFAEARGGLTSAWHALLRRPDRFVSVDTARLVAADSVCGADFLARYAHLADPVAVRERAIAAETREAVLLDDLLPRVMTGENLHELPFYRSADGTWVGRRGGLTGSEFRNDLVDGSWRTRTYRVATGTAAPNSQWFSLEQFIIAVQNA